MNKILEEIQGYGIVPVVKIEKAADALPLGKALVAGGLPLAEITFRTAAAEEVIRTLAQGMPELIVGAGTVLAVEQAQKAIAAGAKFIVAPGFNPKVVRFCQEQGIPVIPGVNSPSQIEAALECGLSVLKFFPAEESGGAAFLKAVAAPYDGVRFIPTGGVNAANLTSYMALKNVFACGGSWMVKGELISAGKFTEIASLTREAIRILLGYELAHLGINHEGIPAAATTVDDLCSLCRWSVAEDAEDHFFVGKREVEVMKGPGRGEKGHLAFNVNDVGRALFYLEKQGVRPIPGTERLKGNRPVFAYLDREIAGFAVHLREKG